MKEADRITKADVMALLAKNAPQGVLSVYIGLPPSDRHDPGRWLSTAHSGLRSLVQSHPEDTRLHETVQTAQTEISGLAVESRHRSLVYFRSLDPDWRFCRSLQLPLTDLFAWDQIPQVRPLVAFLDEYPVLGAAVLSSERARLFTWREGMVAEHPDLLSETVLEEHQSNGESAPLAGAAHGSGVGQSVISKRRAEDRTRRFFLLVARRLGDAAQTQGWQRLLLIGPSSAAAMVGEHLPDAGKKILIPSLERNLIKAASGEIAEVAARQLDAWKRQAETEEVEALIDEARSSRRACLGLQATLDHLRQRRVDRLLFCHDLQVSGYRAADGGLHDHKTGTEPNGSLSPEPHLVERMITSALESGATVVPLEGASSHRLNLLGGVGGRLRWRDADGGQTPERGDGT